MSAQPMHPIFMKRQFTKKEIADGTERAITEFKKQYPEFHPCASNAEMLMDFILSQLGSNEEPAGAPAYPYPYLFENFQFAYHSILDSGRWFYSAPETPQQEQARLRREQAQRQQEIAEENRRRQPERELAAVIEETVQLSKAMPIDDLRVVVANEHPISGGKPHQSVAAPGDESRSHNAPTQTSKPVPAKVMQQARRQVSFDNPTLPRDGVRFNQLVHEFIKKSSNA